MLGWPARTAGKVIALVVVFFLSAGIAVLGHATMIWVQRIFAVLLVVTLAVVFVYTIGGVDWGAGPKEPLSTSATVAAILIGPAWSPRGRSPTFQRLGLVALPAERDAQRSIFWTVVTSAGLIAAALGIMGVILSSRGDVSDPVGGVRAFVPDWLFVIYAIAAIGGAVANNVVTFYASGLVLQSVGVPLRRYQATMVDTTVATLLVVYVVFISESFTTVVNDFLSLLVVWIAPFGGVWLADGMLRRWQYDPVDIHAVDAGPRAATGAGTASTSRVRRPARRHRRLPAHRQRPDLPGAGQQAALGRRPVLDPRPAGGAVTYWPSRRRRYGRRRRGAPRARPRGRRARRGGRDPRERAGRRVLGAAGEDVAAATPAPPRAPRGRGRPRGRSRSGEPPARRGSVPQCGCSRSQSAYARMPSSRLQRGRYPRSRAAAVMSWRPWRSSVAM